ncbi:septum formation initiator family protein [Streptacidiphilus sp. PB12-B1b]|nr:septum formation initiator family protein [Streptacidiphilus sp. PB12-B1b]QMU80150.1 septum formation initiator family protein [Streptacidiphilus sp. PB12-B1b]
MGRVAGEAVPARSRPSAAGRTGRWPGRAARRPGRRPGGRGPFAALVALLLSGGLVGLLLLNTALNQGSFQLSRLQQTTTRLTDEQQGLQQQIADWSAPDALSARARQLGMVPGGVPAFLRDDGSVQGSPQPLSPQPSAPGGNG